MSDAGKFPSQLLDHLLDKQIAKRNTPQPFLAARDGIKNRRVRGLRLQYRRRQVEQWLNRGADTLGQGHFDKNDRFARIPRSIAVNVGYENVDGLVGLRQVDHGERQRQLVVEAGADGAICEANLIVEGLRPAARSGRCHAHLERNTLTPFYPVGL